MPLPGVFSANIPVGKFLSSVCSLVRTKGISNERVTEANGEYRRESGEHISVRSGRSIFNRWNDFYPRQRGTLVAVVSTGLGLNFLPVEVTDKFPGHRYSRENLEKTHFPSFFVRLFYSSSFTLGIKPLARKSERTKEIVMSARTSVLEGGQSIRDGARLASLFFT